MHIFSFIVQHHSSSNLVCKTGKWRTFYFLYQELCSLSMKELLIFFKILPLAPFHWLKHFWNSFFYMMWNYTFSFFKKCPRCPKILTLKSIFLWGKKSFVVWGKFCTCLILCFTKQCKVWVQVTVKKYWGWLQILNWLVSTSSLCYVNYTAVRTFLSKF